MLSHPLIGQEKIKQQLQLQLNSNQVPHAQLFTGNLGRGGLALALDFAFQLLGVSETKSPEQQADLHFVFPVVKGENSKNLVSDDVLPTWFSFLQQNIYGSYSDWFETLEVGNKQGIINVHEIQSLHHKMGLKSFSGGNKVCIIWGMDKMNTEASNKFLKLLEEPPEKTFFLMIAEDVNLLLPTITSRCQITALPPIETNALEGYFTSQNATIAQEWIEKSGGDFAALLKLLVDRNIIDYEKMLIDWLRMAFRAAKDKAVVIDLMDWVNQISRLGRDEQQQLLQFALQFFRDAMILNYDLKNLVRFESRNNFDLEKIAPFIHNGNYAALIEACEKSMFYIYRNANPKIVFTDLALNMSRLIHKKTI